MTDKFLILSLSWFGLIWLNFWWSKPVLAITSSPTPSLNITPYPTTNQIYLTELLAKPTAGDEWVEIYNPNDFLINLTDWQLWDELANPSLIFTFTTQVIPAQAYLVVPINRKLNDSEDGVSLKNPQGQIIDSTHYTNSPPDLSWSRLSLDQQASVWNYQTASPSLPNPQPIPTPTVTVTPTSAPTPTPNLSPTIIPMPTSIKPSLTISLQTTVMPKNNLKVFKASKLPSPKPSLPKQLSLATSKSSSISASVDSNLPALITQKTNLIQIYDVIMIGWSLIFFSCSIWLVFSPHSINNHDSTHQLVPKLAPNSP